jgi:hypothetical protein
LRAAGEFLAARLAESTWGLDYVTLLSHELGIDVSICAPAHAVAVLAREERQT